MLKILRDRSAQAVMSEYVLVFFLVTGMVSAMMIYFKRSIQAKTKDARDYMLQTVLERTAGEYNGSVYYEYEPYYLNTESNLSTATFARSRLRENGRFRKRIEDTSSVYTMSETAPPRDGDTTTANVVYGD